MTNVFLKDVPAERAVLAGIIAYGSQGYFEVADIITTNTFTDEFHQILFQTLTKLLKDGSHVEVCPATIITAASSLGYGEIISRPDEKKLLRAIMNFPINQSNLRGMAMKVRKLEVSRELAQALKRAQHSVEGVNGDEPIDHILSLAEEPIFDLTTRLSSGNTEYERLGDGINDYVDYLASHPVDMVGISSGWPLFDLAIGGGFREGTVNLVGARPKVGKTSFGDNVGIHVAEKLGYPVFNADTEMSKADHRVRILANLAEVPIQEIENGKFSDNQWKAQKVKQAAARLDKMPYYYESVAGKPFEEILATMRRWLQRVVGTDANGKTKPCLIIYDYLKLMNAEGLTKNTQEYQLLGFQISNLHNFMVRYKVPCLAFIQLNRDGITKEDTDVASGSDRQIWLCSNFSIFKKKSEEEIAEDASFNRKLITLVSRHGAGLDDGDYINMKFTGQYNRITEGKTRNQLKADNKKKAEGFVVNDNSQPEQIPFN